MALDFQLVEKMLTIHTLFGQELPMLKPLWLLPKKCFLIHYLLNILLK